MTEASEVELPSPEAGVSLSLRATSGKSLKVAEGWALIGEGYSSNEDAWAAGSRIEDTLVVTLTKLLLGADFGSLASVRGQFTTVGLQQVQQLLKEERVLDDSYGLSVYLSEPKPKFIAFVPKLTIAKDPDKFKQTFLSVLRQGLRPLTPSERHAFNPFLASYFQAAPDSRFLLQVMAVEALIEQAPKPSEAIAYVDAFIKEITTSPLAEIEKRSLIGSLGRLRQESITQAGRRLPPLKYWEINVTMTNLHRSFLCMPIICEANSSMANPLHFRISPG